MPHYGVPYGGSDASMTSPSEIVLTANAMLRGGAAGVAEAVVAGANDEVWTVVAGVPQWAAAAGAVTVTGVPVNNQLAIWTAAADLEGDAALEFAAGVLTVGTVSATTGQVALCNAASALTTTIQAGVAITASRVYTWPVDFGAAGTALVDAAGDGTLSWTAVSGAWGSAGGETTPDTAGDTVVIRETDAGTNTVINKLTLGHRSSGQVITGFGVSMDFNLEENDVAGTVYRQAAIIECRWSDAGDTTSADGVIDFKCMRADAAASSVLKLDGGGGVTRAKSQFTGYAGVGIAPLTHLHVHGAHVSSRGVAWFEGTSHGFVFASGTAGSTVAYGYAHGSTIRWLTGTNAAVDSWVVADGNSLTTLANHRFTVTAAGDVIVGRGEGSDTAATGATLRAPHMETGGTADQDGADMTIAAGLGKGAGDAGQIIFQAAPEIGAGTTLQTLATVLTVDGNKSIYSPAGVNWGVGVSAWGTNGTDVLGITADGTVPSSSPAGMIQIYADDTAAGATTATLALRTEETVTADGDVAGTHTLNIWVNGTEYHLLLAAL